MPEILFFKLQGRESPEEIRIGEVVGWIFNNEEEGYRIK
jgi:hypothetical protein